MRILFVFIVAIVALAIGLVVEMARRNEPMLGLPALGLLTVGGVLGVAYGFLDAA